MTAIVLLFPSTGISLENRNSLNPSLSNYHRNGTINPKPSQRGLSSW
nr:MAG TPA: hypothetical protein [Caudoviricetes sp.]